jgi:transcriptional regulatory protein RtcR
MDASPKAGARRQGIPAKKTVVIGLLGSTLDVGRGPKRWEKWRPTVSVCQQRDWHVDRFELLFNPIHREQAALAQSIAVDMLSVSPDTIVNHHSLPMQDAWDFSEVFAKLSDFAESYSFDIDRNDYYVHITTGTHVAQICMFLLCETRIIPARLLQSSPHGDQQLDGGGNSVIDLDLAKYDKLASRFAKRIEQSQERLKAGIATRNPGFNQLIDELQQVASRSKDPILLGGATGTGKSVLAERLYALKRSIHQITGEFVAVNCATLRGDTAMSALFGHSKGAYTGASETRQGFLKRAHGGLLFLDEIGELGLDEQAMLLTAIEHKKYYAVGSDKEQSSDFQLIAGSNRDLRDAVGRGSFREDLLARIAIWPFHLPTLAQRHQDIEPNLQFELVKLSAALGMGVTFSSSARQRFLDFATGPDGRWPGNFRDFGSSIRRMATLATGGRIDDRDVEREIERLNVAWKTAGIIAIGKSTSENPRQAAADRLLKNRRGTIDHFAFVQLAEVLAVCARSQSLSEAGRALFSLTMTRRSSSNDADRLRKYLAKFGIVFSDLAS